MDDEYLPATQVTSRLEVNISVSTLRNWGDSGRVRIKRMSGGKRLYLLSDVQREVGDAPVIKTRGTGKTIGYARVSSSHQKEDLKRQEEYIRTHHVVDEVISDIGSGLNFNRKGFLRLLSRVEKEGVTMVVVTYRDRMCRFGLELVERIFRTNGTKLVVLCDQSLRTGENEEELANDLLDVCNFFVAKRNGRKSAKYRQERQERQENQEGLETFESHELQDTNVQDGDKRVDQVVPCLQVGLQ